jgi:predicted adenylyl cyclase CyaB
MKIPRSTNSPQERDADEISLLSSTRRTARLFLSALDLRPLVEYRTQRKEWEENGTRVALDRIRGLGLFCEIETSSATTSLEHIARAFGLDEEALEARSYAEILLDGGSTMSL